MITCPLCGQQHSPEASASCRGCALGNACSLSCCPNCGYKVPVESKLGKLLKRLTTKGESRANAQSTAER